MKTKKNHINRFNKTQKKSRFKPRIQDDFYSHNNYQWIKKESHSKNKDMTMDLIIKKKVDHELKNVVLADVLNERTKAGEAMRNIYQSTMKWNNDLIETKIQQFVCKLNEYRENEKKKYEFLAWFTKCGFDSPIRWNIEIDAKVEHEYISHLTENGLTFTDKVNYLNNEKKYKTLRKEYIFFLKSLFVIAFGKNHKYDVKSILQIERKIAENIYSNKDILYIKNTYNKYTSHECNEKLHFDWNKLATQLGFEIPPKDLIIENPNYIKNISELLKTWNESEWESYWVYQILIIASKFHKPLFICFTHFLNIVNKREEFKTIDMKKLALANEKTYMNMHISKKYIELFKNTKEIEYCEELILRFKHTLKKRLHENSWLHTITKEKSIKKLNNMTIVVGCKEKWESDPDIEYSSVDSWKNYILFNECNVNRDIKLVGKKMPSKKIWLQVQDQNVYDVNAYYNSFENELILPNAILQKPFVDINKNMAYNLASIGCTIGHEIMHAFDDDGYTYDENGVYVPDGWWQEQDIKIYKKKQHKIRNQYNIFANRDKLNINTELTLTEDIADIGGFLLTENVLIDYLNEKQIYDNQQDKYLKEFYINYSKNWRSNQNLNFFRKRLNYDEHSYSKYRVNCVLSHSKNFQRIYDINPNDGMYYPFDDLW